MEKSFFFSEKYPVFLFIIVIILIIITGIDPPHPQDFFYEHIATIVFLAFLLFTYRHFKFSNVSYTLIFVFLILHIIGARSTYSDVPYNQFFINNFGFDLNEFFGFTRNNYDRLVHFSFGLLLAYPIRELFWRIASAKGIWRYYLPLELIMAFSMIYELIEYGFVVIVGGDVSHTYLGSQGDIWDAQKDMLLATLGGFISLTVIFFINLFYNKKFSLKKEIIDGLKVSRKTPLGEIELRRLMKNN